MEKIGILFGGPSVEHEVSIISAKGVFENIDKKLFKPALIYMDKNGNWYPPAISLNVLEGKKPPEKSRVPFEEIIKVSNLKIVFPLIHGTFGEDGTLQGYLEALGLKYVGCGVKASAIGMDKELCKKIWEKNGLPVVPFILIKKENFERDFKEIKKEIKYPVFVKPADSGSSIGITKVKKAEELKNAIENAFKISRKVLIEKAINGREIEVSILGSYDPEYISPPGEIIPSKEFYDYEDKYKLNKAKLLVPAQLPENIKEKFMNLAKNAFVSIDGYGMARVDFFLEDGERIYLNEINTIPGFTPISMYPKLLSLCGIPYKDLITKLIELAKERI